MSARSPRWLVLVGIVAVSFNLRPAAVSIGPVLDDITDGLQMSSTEAGILTSLPVFAFAVFGALAPVVSRLIGPHRTTLLALICEVAGLFLRSHVDSVTAFLLLSLLALAGMATANVLLPPLVKLHFPDRIGLMTSIYSTSLAIGLTSASVFTVPIADAYGGWRSALVAWAGFGAIAIIPWLFLVVGDTRGSSSGSRIGLGRVARTRLGWVMACFFGLQSLLAYSIFGWFAQIYHDAGFSAHTAGLLLGVITGISIPLSFAIPAQAARMSDQTPLMWAILACYPVGFLGLAIAPHALAWLWAVVVGIGTCAFPLILTLIGLRSRTPEGTAALSGFTQSVGYLIAVIGPFGVGLLHDLSGSWDVPLVALTLVVIPLLGLGRLAARPRFVEDELGLAASPSTPTI